MIEKNSEGVSVRWVIALKGEAEEIIKNYGSDAVRLFLVSDSPPEKDIQWSEEGISACYKFIQKSFTI